ncbi:glycoside hydrolase family 85 protein [Plicaturopsis crispa FD-325 SS-3]|uniref:Glycoside hydrolase family 85 protein n=1 Tax=Plicaturopsis crispa FD-325 SS-3 TaxID=944288 RepID=A0A0C9T289_PLICR|nr:glycoside hydrolase family 85 protein [Plicaturopsis crispa FD-325 SS-3]
MPLRGKDHSALVKDSAPYFDSLEELDTWARVPSAKLGGVLQYHARSAQSDGLSSDNRGRLLVCHDYKGGYTESPSALSYTFNFWSACDTFVYFSHRRVTVPPPGWINAAHRQGVKILGTLIFEGSGEEDCLRLLVGHLPKSKTGPVIPSSFTLPLSAHYARLLADLAYQRGFDGYLLNLECPLRGGVEQTKALAAWNTLLQSELLRKVGAHAQTIWYDSVIVNGQLRWQDRLNSLNLPFFLSASSIFTNYTWPSHYPSLTAQYFLSLDPALRGEGDDADVRPSVPKSLRDIFVGVDVWGRGSHGGGGFGSYKAISHIDPEFLGLSVALFGQAWTWESEQDKSGWDWDQWWAYEQKLWVGPHKKDEAVVVPPAKLREGEPECPHGPFQPVASFFPRDPPPDPVDLALYTSFSPGVGRAWFVEGVNVLQTDDGWTDVDKQGSLGDMLWPRPLLAWEGDDRQDELPDVSPAISMADAWNGGSSVRLEISGRGSDAEDAFFRCVWIPVQSLSVSSQQLYEAILVYKEGSDPGVDLDIGISVKLLSASSDQSIEVQPSAISHTQLAGGWAKLSVEFKYAGSISTASAAIGLVVGFAAEDPTQPFEFSVNLGQLAVYPLRSLQNVSPHTPRVIWADFERDSSNPSGVLTWDTAVSFPTAAITITSPEDPLPAWTLDNSGRWLPTFLYFNIYAQSTSQYATPQPDGAVFIGTTGLSGDANRFFVDANCLPESTKGAEIVRFYVQGVTDRGQVLPWVQCAYVDVKW